MMNDSKNWRFCVVGNIVETHPDEDGILRHGTKAFVGGTKVYIPWKGLDDLEDREGVLVIGLNRFHRYAVEYVPFEWMENIRFQILFKLTILDIIDQEEAVEGAHAWGRTADDKRGARAFAERLAIRVGDAKQKNRSAFEHTDRPNRSQVGTNGLYTEIWDGMKRFSAIDMHYLDLAYYSKHSHDAGLWGYQNEDGEVVIEPQYIFAKDFYKGLAFVCKGEWTREKKWDNKYVTGGYWSEKMLWGAIDKTGKEVIACIYDEIEEFDIDDYFYVHYGGWERGRWGVIDRQGKWIVPPIFAGIDSQCSREGLFIYYNEDPEHLSYEPPMGIYDMKKGKVVFQPQFRDVDFLDNGWIKVELYEEENGRPIKKFIDRTGKEIATGPEKILY